jgi:cytochrome c oxidase assembly protein subunit 11
MVDLSHPAQSAERKGNRRIAFALSLIVVIMVGAAFAAVPLYQMLCRAIGLDGTTQVSTGNPKGVIAREMTVRFDSNISNDLPWTIVPSKPVKAKIGTVETVVFKAHNFSDKAVTGQAMFNVTPELTGIYFNKIECFCFTEQTLKPGETVDMPVTFFVDPDIASNSDLNTIRDITLSYTFYAVPSEGS